ncbi:hypothetical protein RRG08_053111, partial [Elysia crispata]
RKIEITFGLNREKEKSEDYGMMLYNKNRLIRAFERVGCQKKADVNGVGVIGIAEVDFLQPVHNKQDFQVDKKYNTVMRQFGTKLNEYWDQQNMTDNSLSSSAPTGFPIEHVQVYNEVFKRESFSENTSIQLLTDLELKLYVCFKLYSILLK